MGVAVAVTFTKLSVWAETDNCIINNNNDAKKEIILFKILYLQNESTITE
jgi:hypothetical protein